MRAVHVTAHCDWALLLACARQLCLLTAGTFCGDVSARSNGGREFWCGDCGCAFATFQPQLSICRHCACAVSLPWMHCAASSLSAVAVTLAGATTIVCVVLSSAPWVQHWCSLSMQGMALMSSVYTTLHSKLSRRGVFLQQQHYPALACRRVVDAWHHVVSITAAAGFHI